MPLRVRVAGKRIPGGNSKTRGASEVLIANIDQGAMGLPAPTERGTWIENGRVRDPGLQLRRRGTKSRRLL